MAECHHQGSTTHVLLEGIKPGIKHYDLYIMYSSHEEVYVKAKRTQFRYVQTFFMSFIPAAVLMSRPPESKQTPFPTRHTKGRSPSEDQSPDGDHLQLKKVGVS